MEWVSVDDRPPKTDGEYFTVFLRPNNTQGTVAALYSDGEWWWDSKYGSIVTHWIKVPALPAPPPKPKEEPRPLKSLCFMHYDDLLDRELIDGKVWRFNKNIPTTKCGLAGCLNSAPWGRC